jgi:hypothetical protein
VRAFPGRMQGFGGGAVAAPLPATLAGSMDRLFDLVFSSTTTGMNEKVKANFKTPLQTLTYLQSLVGIVLDDEEPQPASIHFWKHLHRCRIPPRERMRADCTRGDPKPSVTFSSARGHMLCWIRLP